MSSYAATRIEKPKYFKIAPALRGRGSRETIVIGFDSEAEKGRAFTLQFSKDGGPEDATLLTVGEQRHAALSTLFGYIHATCSSRKVNYVIFGWNLAYEWTQLFGEINEDAIYEQQFRLPIALTYPNGVTFAHYDAEVMNDRRYAMRIVHLESKVRIIMLDGMAFFKTSLNKAGKALGLGEKVQIDDKRKRLFSRADIDDPEFRRYACTDAWLTREIGRYIVGMHEQYDVRQTLTAPHFASMVFKRHFLRAEIALPTPALEQAGLAAYHGGKNGFYLPGPQRLTGVWNYDITSAYPEAMRQLPDPTTARWREAASYRAGAHGLWHVTMDYAGCRYPGGLTHDDHKLTPGHHAGLWLTSYELDAILERGEARVRSCEGYVMEGDEGGPLVAFVDTFFAQKAASVGPMREQAKLFLNSLYGKFFQKVELGTVGYVLWGGDGAEVTTNPDQPFDYRAGGLYHPPIAGLITGFVRAKIHRLEHKYESVMTSTDGYFGLVPPDPDDLGARLGGLTVERGDLSIWRERLYVFDPESGKVKAALHGFRGSVDHNDECPPGPHPVHTLREIPLAPGEHTYRGEAVVSLRMARGRVGGRLRRAGEFVERDYTLVIEGA